MARYCAYADFPTPAGPESTIRTGERKTVEGTNGVEETEELGAVATAEEEVSEGAQRTGGAPAYGRGGGRGVDGVEGVGDPGEADAEGRSRASVAGARGEM